VLLSCLSYWPIKCKIWQFKTFFTPQPIHFQLNLNTNNERVNSPNILMLDKYFAVMWVHRSVNFVLDRQACAPYRYWTVAQARPALEPSALAVTSTTARNTQASPAAHVRWNVVSRQSRLVLIRQFTWMNGTSCTADITTARRTELFSRFTFRRTQTALNRISNEEGRPHLQIQ